MFKSFIVLIAILSIAIIEIQAIRMGLDGILLSISLVLISGLAGYEFPALISFLKRWTAK